MAARARRNPARICSRVFSSIPSNSGFSLRMVRPSSFAKKMYAWSRAFKSGTRFGGALLCCTSARCLLATPRWIRISRSGEIFPSLCHCRASGALLNLQLSSPSSDMWSLQARKLELVKTEHLLQYKRSSFAPASSKNKLQGLALEREVFLCRCVMEQDPGLGVSALGLKIVNGRPRPSTSRGHRLKVNRLATSLDLVIQFPGVDLYVVPDR